MHSTEADDAQAGPGPIAQTLQPIRAQLVLAALLSFAGLQRGIADPWYTDDFGTTYDDLVLGCTAFLDALRRRVGGTRA